MLLKYFSRKIYKSNFDNSKVQLSAIISRRIQIRIVKPDPDPRAELNADPDAQHCEKEFEGSSTTAAKSVQECKRPSRPSNYTKRKRLLGLPQASVGGQDSGTKLLDGKNSLVISDDINII